ncbi:lipase 3-like [Ischnura elegans]|uniref:lipase 3-like n=1 Tax=Ischnura elegans TaxID=197161 RepID=UPI001ED866FC|nr:lipase 3-like [Ischnura elegans]
MKTISCFVLIVCLAIGSATPVAKNIQCHDSSEETKDVSLPEILMTTVEMIEYHGYPAEEYEVQTDDGYVLKLHRIPHGKSGRSLRREQKVVFLQHGLLCSSADWVMMGPKEGLAFILADAGYDVWMGNARGNTYSKKHISLSTNDAKFWDFSWDEMGKHDLPAEIDFVLQHTGKSDLFYAGHSMGTTMFYVMCAERPEYNAKIRAQFSLAPVAFMSRVQTPLRLLAPFIDEIDWVMKMLGVNEFMPHSDLLDMIGLALCKDGAITQALCSDVLFLISGFDSKELNRTALPIITAHTPAGASTKTIVHYVQEINSGKFRQYDYGRSGNEEKYGSSSPPEYDLSKITAPMYFHYGQNDLLANVEDVEILYRTMPGTQGKFEVPFEKFNHLDFLWAIDAPDLLYYKMVGLMARH